MFQRRQGEAPGEEYRSLITGRIIDEYQKDFKVQLNCQREKTSMPIEFTNHNIRLDDGTFTKPEMGYSMESYPWFVSARRVLETIFPADKSRLRLADLGCLEGGYAVEFARLGFQVLGLEVRDSNLAACRYVKSKTSLPNLEFVKDDAWNVTRYGTFDAVFCCGLLYHLDKPKQFLETLSSVTKKLVILQTHFSTDPVQPGSRLPPWVRKVLRKRPKPPTDGHNLSPVDLNEGLVGRWYTEFSDNASFENRETAKWASWDNRRSFWI